MQRINFDLVFNDLGQCHEIVEDADVLIRVAALQAMPGVGNVSVQMLDNHPQK